LGKNVGRGGGVPRPLTLPSPMYGPNQSVFYLEIGQITDNYKEAYTYMDGFLEGRTNWVET
jgi:hypothetical protein